MLLRDIMTPHVECLWPEDNLVHAAERMRDVDVGAMRVCGVDDRLTGIITDRDITVRGTAGGRNPADTTVAEIMTPGIQYCFDDEDIAEAAHIMEQKQIRRLAVLNHQKRLVGIVSLGDLAVKSHDRSLSGEALECISEPAMA